MKTNNIIRNTLKGMAIGGSMTIPGVSGGTVAIILNIYDELISSVSQFFKQTKKSLLTLSTVGFGAVLGMLMLSKLILFAKDNFYLPIMYLFMGAVLGSVPMLYKKANISKINFKVLLYPILGASLVLLIDFIPKDALNFNSVNDIEFYILVFVVGLILSVALILPGISASYMLLIFGIYEKTFSSIHNMDFLFLGILLLGVCTGVCATTKVLENVMNRYPQATYLLIIGFVLASLREVFPGIPLGIDIIVCLLTLFSGILVTLLLSNVKD